MPDLHKQIVNNHEFRMLFVEGGTFDMGSPNDDAEAYGDERPQHRVRVPDFYIGKYPVTQALWKTVMDGKNPSRFQGDDLPVEQVSWDDAQMFVKKLNGMTESARPAGYLYRLPTEAEWEYAARGGKYHGEGYKYAGSDRLKDIGWFEDNSGSETKPVGLKYPNQLGIHDMSGNVWEWCEDWFARDYYEQCNKKGIVENPKGPENGTYRVNCGGGWDYPARDCRAASRRGYAPDYRDDDLGFRLALSLQ